MSDEHDEDEAPVNYSLKPKEKKFCLDGEMCTMKELLGDERDKYLNSISGKVRFVNGKASGMKSYKGVQGGLLILCLFKEDDTLFSMDEVQQFPASVQNDLYKTAQKMSGLDKEAEEDAKND